MPAAGQLEIGSPLDPVRLEPQLHDATSPANILSPNDASAMSAHAFKINSPHDAMHATPPDHNMMGTAQFGDFSFSYQELHDAGAMVSLGETKFDEHDAADQFSPQQASAPPENRDAPMQDLSPIPSFGALPAATAERDLSLDPSPGSLDDGNSPGVHSLEDSVADEFGLSSTGRQEGADTASRPKDDKSDGVPSWSELKTKAGKERKRLPLACIACRRKKIRCSGEKPACKHCIRSRIPCVYKVTTRKAAPRTDYMAMLDKRLKRMEERIIKVIPKAEQDASTIQRAVVKPAIPGSTPASKGSTKKRGADEAFGHDLDRWARAPSKTKPDGSSKPSALQIQEDEESKLFVEGLDALPPKDIQEHLAEVFFDNIYGQAYHILHKPSYMRKLRAGTLPPVLVLSVCAIAARFSTHPKLTSSPNFLRGEEWASCARDICTKRYEWPNITILTCLLILGLHEFGTCHGGRSWALGGQAIRMAFALQLHKDLEHDPLRIDGKTELSFVDREIRRRTMWACFLMDRLNSSGTDRPMFIREETLRIPLPVKEQYFQLDMPAPTETLGGEVMHPIADEDGQLTDAKKNMGVAAYMVRSIALWGRIINYLNQGGKEMDSKPFWNPDSEYSVLVKEAEDILETLPESLKYSADNLQLHNTENMANQFLFLHISIQQNILFLNRVAVASPSKAAKQEVPKVFVTKAGTRTFAAADRISDLLKDAESYFVTAPFVGYCAFSSSTIHILGIFSGNPAMEVSSKRNLATNVKFLSRMKRYWGMFHWMSENLREQYRAYADAARQGSTTNEKATASPIFQYGDWFDRYPHGVSQSDFVDPVSLKKREKGDEAVLEQKPELHTVEEYFTTLSPSQSSEGRGEAARPGQAKRKAVAKKPGGAQDHQQQQIDPMMGDFEPGVSSEQPDVARLAHQRSFSGSLNGQANGPAGFNPVNMAHSQASAYHAMSPISPIALGQYGHHGHHHPAFYTPELLSMGLSQQAMASMIQPLDRQMVFGAYSMDPGGVPNAGSLDPVEWERLARSRAQAQAEGHRRGIPPGAGRMGYAGGARHPLETMAAFGPEASTAWFMPFNMEPPELGHDLGMGLDGLGNMFGGGGSAGGGGVNGIRHGH
ncbi:related to nitrate assimilation regulatory protein nirA [Cephalotrichum gorgonifer]|uniref:Related to nitrate assimilation regulatory protein nirA n=1 Tax=Cephalotrichum gorgonifer TaxID=2041049 RepID=A0AAE8SVH8_9PEZI|nr:related to nitrate assimilation regulatory protein nirA [Cephalotrichum gorgonifer]